MNDAPNSLRTVKERADAILSLQSTIDELLPGLREAAAAARADGHTWAEIANVLGGLDVPRGD